MNYSRQIPRQFSRLWMLSGLLWIASCAKGPDFVRSYGPETTEVRKLDAFHSIVADKKFIVFLTQDSTLPEQVTISYGKHLLHKIKTTVTDGVLTLDDNNTFNWVRNLRVNPKCTVNLKNITEIKAFGASRFVCLDTLRVNSIGLHINSVNEHRFLLNADWITGKADNAGTVLFFGKCFGFSWTLENGAWCNAAQLHCSDAYIYHFTDRNAYVNPQKLLAAKLYGKGNLFYTTEPSFKLEKLENGDGRVIKY